MTGIIGRVLDALRIDDQQETIEDLSDSDTLWYKKTWSDAAGEHATMGPQVLQPMRGDTPVGRPERHTDTREARLKRQGIPVVVDKDHPASGAVDDYTIFGKVKWGKTYTPDKKQRKSDYL